ncbi:MAG: peptidoglycan editing factor PgeF [Pigmentiphaga sp.]|nr:peptidoglycan editing factor PgeF [Pigmentiphaga sp.]
MKDRMITGQSASPVRLAAGRPEFFTAVRSATGGPGASPPGVATAAAVKVAPPQPLGPGTWRGPAWPGVEIRVTSREGGSSRAPYDAFNLGEHVGDDPLAVKSNRESLRRWLPDDPCWLTQVHGVTVYDADAVANTLGEAPRADAAISRRAGRVLAVLTADCLPVVLADGEAGIVAVAHAGWRGLAAGVLETTVAAMRGGRSGERLRLRAWMGPAIGHNAFEVGDDVREAMGARGAFAFRPKAGAPGKWWCDLTALAADRLQGLGVEDIAAAGVCTVQDDRWYSFRRDGRTGRFVTLVWWNPADLSAIPS